MSSAASVSDGGDSFEDNATQVATQAMGVVRAFETLSNVPLDSKDRVRSARVANARFNVRFTDRPTAQKTRKCRSNTRRCMYGLVRKDHFVRCANCVSRHQGFYCRKHADLSFDYYLSMVG